MKWRIWEGSIARTLNVLLMVFSFLSLLVLTGTLVSVNIRDGERSIANRAQTLTSMLAENLEPVMLFSDEMAASNLLAALDQVPELRLACVYDRHKLLSQWTSTDLRCPPSFDGSDPEASIDYAGELATVQRRDEAGGLIGQVLLLHSRDALYQRQLEFLGIAALAFGLAMLLSLLLAKLLRARLVEPVLGLSQLARDISQTQDYARRSTVPEREDEIYTLSRDFNEMISRIEAAQAELRTTNASLEQEVAERIRAVKNLKEAQNQLVESEKMAALGGLVAGVAHEVNNPIGVCITAASQLSLELAEVSTKASRGEMTRTEFDTRFSAAERLNALVVEQLQRAGQLVEGFKRMAVDQLTDDLQRIDLAEYLGSLALSLEPQVKRSGHAIEVRAPQELLVNCNPGVLSQIVTNLVINALRHAYREGHSGGHILLGVEAEGDHVHLWLRDDGAGMDDDVLRKIFEPFFTTRRGQGGSGLGLHLVYNLVTQKLQGQISVESAPGQGSTFSLRFPRSLDSAPA